MNLFERFIYWLPAVLFAVLLIIFNGVFWLLWHPTPGPLDGFHYARLLGWLGVHVFIVRILYHVYSEKQT